MAILLRRLKAINLFHTVTHASFTISESGIRHRYIWWIQGGDYMFQPVLSSRRWGIHIFVLDASNSQLHRRHRLATLSRSKPLAISVDMFCLRMDTEC